MWLWYLGSMSRSDIQFQTSFMFENVGLSFIQCVIAQGYTDLHVELWCQGQTATSGESRVLVERSRKSSARGCTDLFCHTHLGLNSTSAGVKYLLSGGRDRSAALACRLLWLMHCEDNRSSFFEACARVTDPDHQTWEVESWCQAEFRILLHLWILLLLKMVWLGEGDPGQESLLSFHC